jgi:uncharacterized protein
MTQPAKVQEPSMEEILASIRRIIADDDAKPAATEKAATDAAVAKPQAVPPASKPAPAKPVAMTGAPAPVIVPKPAASAAPAPAASNSQDDIDAMLASLDAATTEDEVRPAQADEVFELTDEMALPDPAQAAFQKVEPQDDLEFVETASAARPRLAAVDRPTIPDAAPAAQILSHSTVSAVETAFNTLANTVLSNNARTLEDLVKEMLRPMLKSWLDDNLPGVVERIVKAEIERVSRGRS